MNIIGFYNQKGGVGKTAMSVNLAAVFADHLGKRVAIVDMDGQINTTQYLLSNDENYFVNGQYNEDNYNISNIISNDCSIQNCITYRTFSRYSAFKQIDYKIAVIPGTSQINYLEFSSMFCLQEQLKNLEDEFDYIFIDLPPSDSTAVAIALAACDYVICPSEAELDSMNGFKKLLDLVDDINVNYESNITVLGIFINKFMKVRAFQKAIQEELMNFDESYLFKTYIPNDPRVPESRGMRMPLESFAHSCDANKALQKLAKEIVAKIEKIKRG